MRFSTLIIISLFLGLLSLSLFDAASSLNTLGSRVEKIRSTYMAKSFIAESFKKTCEGKGFDSLEEWQLCCRAMFGLEYIAWCPAENFMIDRGAERGAGRLMYGKWTGSQELKACSGEVFYRSRD